MNIYKITCTVSGDIYVGQTIKDISIRLREHISKSQILKTSWGSCPKLAAAIRKYGSDAFVIELLDTALSRAELNLKEEYWIKQLNSIENGYNLTTGGFGQLSSEARLKLSKAKTNNQARLGMKNSSKVRKMISDRMKGDGNPMFGKPSHLRKELHCITNGRTYSSIKEASKELGIPLGNMSKLLKGKRSHIGGYQFVLGNLQENGRG